MFYERSISGTSTLLSDSVMYEVPTWGLGQRVGSLITPVHSRFLYGPPLPVANHCKTTMTICDAYNGGKLNPQGPATTSKGSSSSSDSSEATLYHSAAMLEGEHQRYITKRKAQIERKLRRGDVWESAVGILKPYYLHPDIMSEGEFVLFALASLHDSTGWIEDNIRRFSHRAIQLEIEGLGDEMLWLIQTQRADRSGNLRSRKFALYDDEALRILEDELVECHYDMIEVVLNLAAWVAIDVEGIDAKAQIAALAALACEMTPSDYDRFFEAATPGIHEWMYRNAWQSTDSSRDSTEDSLRSAASESDVVAALQRDQFLTEITGILNACSSPTSAFDLHTGPIRVHYPTIDGKPEHYKIFSSKVSALADVWLTDLWAGPRCRYSEFCIYQPRLNVLHVYENSETQVALGASQVGDEFITINLSLLHTMRNPTEARESGIPQYFGRTLFVDVPDNEPVEPLISVKQRPDPSAEWSSPPSIDPIKIAFENAVNPPRKCSDSESVRALISSWNARSAGKDEESVTPRGDVKGVEQTKPSAEHMVDKFRKAGFLDSLDPVHSSARKWSSHRVESPANRTESFKRDCNADMTGSKSDITSIEYRPLVKDDLDDDGYETVFEILSTEAPASAKHPHMTRLRTRVKGSLHKVGKFFRPAKPVPEAKRAALRKSLSSSTDELKMMAGQKWRHVSWRETASFKGNEAAGYPKRRKSLRGSLRTLGRGSISAASGSQDVGEKAPGLKRGKSWYGSLRPLRRGRKSDYSDSSGSHETGGKGHKRYAAKREKFWSDSSRPTKEMLTKRQRGSGSSESSGSSINQKVDDETNQERSISGKADDMVEAAERARRMAREVLCKTDGDGE